MSYQSIFKGDEESSEEGGGGSTVERAESEVCDGYEEEAEGGRNHPHGNVRDVGFEGLSDIFEVEVSIVAENESGKRDEEFCEWRVDIDVVLRLDVFRGELPEVDLIEASNVSDEIEPKDSKETYTTLFGLLILKSLTAAPTIMMNASSFHSPVVSRRPPGGK